MDPPVSIPFDGHRPQSFSRPLLFLVEGQHDIEFLRRISAKLSLELPEIPDLAALERAGSLVFVPVGGGNMLAWSNRFAPCDNPEIHIYDREIPPETSLRRQAIERVNSRSRCRAYLTSKRSLENYLHPKAIVEAGGPDLSFGDDDRVAEFVGRAKLSGTDLDWNNLSRRGRNRSINRVKWWLNTVAVEHMSLELLRERDRQGDIVLWLQMVAILLKSCSAE